MTPLSVLDLSPVIEGSDVSQSLAASLDLARHVERLGFRRYWLAEHHNMPGIASAATAVVIAHVAAGTSTIRVGSGGIMLPNHAPLLIAEQFGTLAALHPGRIDLGIGRAPGTDQVTAHAMRRSMSSGVDNFPQDVVELINYFAPAEEGQRVRAVPGEGLNVPVWILGSSTYGAQLAAILGLPYAFASHFSPGELMHALAIYRERFQPSAFLDKPYAMAGLNVVAADTDAEAKRLFTSVQQSFIRLRTGRPGKLPPPIDDIRPLLDGGASAMMSHALSEAVIGAPATVAAGLEAFIARTGVDEVIVTSQIYDHAARKHSYSILADVHGAMAKAA